MAASGLLSHSSLTDELNRKVSYGRGGTLTGDPSTSPSQPCVGRDIGVCSDGHQSMLKIPRNHSLTVWCDSATARLVGYLIYGTLLTVVTTVLEH